MIVNGRLKKIFERQYFEHICIDDNIESYYTAFKKFFQETVENDEYYIQLKKLSEKLNCLENEIKNALKKASQKLKQTDGKNEMNKLSVKKIFPKIDGYSSLWSKRVVDENGVVVKHFFTASEFYDKKVYPENYYISTNAVFDEIVRGDDCFEVFNSMKQKSGYEYIHSYYGNSEYLFNRGEKTVYRLSDHWGGLGACRWLINKGAIEDGIFILAKCSISNMRMVEDWCYILENPKYIDYVITDIINDVVEFCQLLERLDVCFTDDAGKKICEYLDELKEIKCRYDNELNYMFNDYINKFLKL